MFPEYSSLNLLLLVTLWLVLPVLSSVNRICRTVVLLPMIAIQLWYVNWRITETVEVFEFSAAIIWQYMFLVTEMIVIVYSIWQCITLIRFTNRSGQCDLLVAKNSTGSRASADIFIPTYSESKAILEATIKAAKEDQHSNVTIWICDDSDRAWLRELCLAEGVRYLNRPTTQPLRTKAANLNWAIPHGKAEYVLCLDADFQLAPMFTTRLTSFFDDLSVALVQAPQHFRNPDPIQRNLAGGSAWTEEQRFFFDISLPSRDAWGNALCVGSCWAARRSVIDELGGFPVNSIVEDVYLGYRVKSLGYKTLYLNENLATGLAAEDTPSYIVQRSRWCLGAIALLSDPHGPIRGRGLTLIDRLFYFEISYYWLTHLHMLMLLLAPILFGLFGYNVFNCTIEELFTILIPKNILLAAVFYWISDGRCMPIVTPIQKTVAIFQVSSAIFRGVFFPKNMKFEVTRKDISHSDRTFHWRLAAPFIFIGIAISLAIFKTLSQNYSEFYWSDYSAYNALLSAYAMVTVFLCCLVCVDKPINENNEKSEISLTGSWWGTSVVLFRRIFT